MVARISSAAIALVVVAMCVAIPSRVWAQGVVANVDRTEISLNDTVLFTVTVNTGGASIQAPAGSGFTVLGRSSGITTQIVNRQRTTQMTERFQLQPTTTGTMQVGPALVILPNGAQQYTPIFNVVVTGTSTRQPPPIGATAAPQRPQVRTNNNVQPTLGDDGIPLPPRPASEGMATSEFPATGPSEPFLVVQTSHSEAVVGEQIVVDFLAFIPTQTFGVTMLGLSEPEWGNAWFSDITDQRTRGRNALGQVNANGGRFDVSLMRSVTVVPLEPGEFVIPPLELELQLRTLGANRRQFAIASPPTLIEVREPPEDARPDDFAETNVGRFTLTATVDQRTAAVGEPLSLQVTLAGAGLLQQVEAPSLPDVPGVRWYEPTEETESEVGRDGWIRGRRTITAAFVPDREGTLTLPPFTLTFYDPWLDAYVSEETEPIVLQIAPGARVDDIPEVVDVDREWTEELPEPRPISSSVPVPALRPSVFWSAAAAPCLFAGLMLLLHVRRTSVASQAPVVAKRDAAKNARHAIAAAQAPRDVAAAAREYLGLKLQRVLRGTPIERLRAEAIASTPNMAALIDAIEAAELAQYGGGLSLEALKTQAGDAIDTVEGA